MSIKTTVARLLFALIVFCGVATPIAQQQPPPSAAQEGFVPVDQLPKPQDTMPAAPLVATAYAFVWLMLFGYMVSIWRRLNAVERELQSVSRRIGTGGHTP
jgi:CcmD family protein